MKVKKMTIIEGLLLIISPLISILIIGLGILKGKKSSFYFFVIFLSILGFALVPYETDDLTRYYSYYNNIGTISFNKEIIFNLIVFIFKKLRMPKEILPLFSVFIVNIIYVKIFLEILEKSNKKRIKIMIIIFIINIISFKLAASNIRMPLATAFMILGIWKINKNEIKKGIMISVLSISFHFMMLPYFILILFWIILKETSLKKFKIIFIIAIILGLILNQKILGDIFLKFNSIFKLNLEKKIEIYTIGHWANDYIKERSVKGKILDCLVNFNNIFTICYLFFTKRNNQLEKYIYLSFSFAFLLSSFPLIKNRYMYLGLILINFIFIIDIKNANVKIKKFKIFYILLSIFMFFLGIYAERLTYNRTLLKINFKSLFLISKEKTNEKDYIIKK